MYSKMCIFCEWRKIYCLSHMRHSEAFRKICPAGKGYFLQNTREILAFPPIIFPRKPDKEGESLNVLLANPRVKLSFSYLSYLFSFQKQSSRWDITSLTSTISVICYLFCCSGNVTFFIIQPPDVTAAVQQTPTIASRTRVPGKLTYDITIQTNDRLGVKRWCPKLIRTEVQHVVFCPKVSPLHLSMLDLQLINPPLQQSSDCPQATTPSKHRQKSRVSSSKRQTNSAKICYEIKEQFTQKSTPHFLLSCSHICPSGLSCAAESVKWEPSPLS